jgi:hypothetical protein
LRSNDGRAFVGFGSSALMSQSFYEISRALWPANNTLHSGWQTVPGTACQPWYF